VDGIPSVTHVTSPGIDTTTKITVTPNAPASPTVAQPVAATSASPTTQAAERRKVLLAEKLSTMCNQCIDLALIPRVVNDVLEGTCISCGAPIEPMDAARQKLIQSVANEITTASAAKLSK
jgi:hypothetical protein